jgi:hypothetical protein
MAFCGREWVVNTRYSNPRPTLKDQQFWRSIHAHCAMSAESFPDPRIDERESISLNLFDPL